MAKDKDEIDELKGLSPEARIKKLKELQEKSKKEIEAAQKLIKQSEGEIAEQEKLKEKVPIPQLIAEEERSLEATEEKELFEARREKIGQKPGVAVKEKPEKSLEEQLRKEHIQELTQKSTEQLKEMMVDIYKRAEAQGGYMTGEQREGFYNIAVAEKNKIYQMQEGNYPTEQMSSALENISATFAMSKKLRSMYEAKGDGGGGGSPGGTYQ